VDSLWRRQARDVPEGILDDFVALGWMTWRCGALELTPAGQAVHDLVVAAGSQP
jgi:hypothetical protein